MLGEVNPAEVQSERPGKLSVIPGNLSGSNFRIKVPKTALPAESNHFAFPGLCPSHEAQKGYTSNAAEVSQDGVDSAARGEQPCALPKSKLQSPRRRSKPSICGLS